MRRKTSVPGFLKITRDLSNTLQGRQLQRVNTCSMSHSSKWLTVFEYRSVLLPLSMRPQNKLEQEMLRKVSGT